MDETERSMADVVIQGNTYSVSYVEHILSSLARAEAYTHEDEGTYWFKYDESRLLGAIELKDGYLVYYEGKDDFEGTRLDFDTIDVFADMFHFKDCMEKFDRESKDRQKQNLVGFWARCKKAIQERAIKASQKTE